MEIENEEIKTSTEIEKSEEIGSIHSVISNTISLQYKIDNYFNPPHYLSGNDEDIHLNIYSISSEFNKPESKKWHKITLRFFTSEKDVAGHFLKPPFLRDEKILEHLKDFSLETNDIQISIERLHGIQLPSYYFAYFYRVSKNDENKFRKYVQNLFSELILRQKLSASALQSLELGIDEISDIVNYWDRVTRVRPLSNDLIGLIRSRIKLFSNKIANQPEDRVIRNLLTKMIDSLSFEIETQLVIYNATDKFKEQPCQYCKKSFFFKRLFHVDRCTYDDRFYLLLPNSRQDLGSLHLSLITSDEMAFDNSEIDIETLKREILIPNKITHRHLPINEWILQETCNANYEISGFPPDIRTMNLKKLILAIKKLMESDIYSSDISELHLSAELKSKIEELNESKDQNIKLKRKINKAILACLYPLTFSSVQNISFCSNLWCLDFNSDKTFPKDVMEKLLEKYSDCGHSRMLIYMTFNEIIDRGDCQKSMGDRKYYLDNYVSGKKFKSRY